MQYETEGQASAGEEIPRRLFVYTTGFLARRRLRRILSLAGYRIALGRPAETDFVGVWGQSPYAHRGEAVAAKTGATLVRIEDAFLRSLHPGRSGEPPLGLLIDRSGVHFDGRAPSDLETLLNTHPLDDTALLDRARGVMARMQAGALSKYSATRLDLDPPDPGYVLVIDQTREDASVRASGGDRSRFLEMLTVARQENPGARFLIKTHPETSAGFRPGHYRPEDCAEGIALYDGTAAPQALLEGAVRVYTLSSQMGFEALLAGHRPRVFGAPFYAGWGLTEDEDPMPRRGRNLTRAQLVAGAMILFPHWYDPYRDRLCEIEDVLSCLEARSRAWREDRAGWIASGMRLWKRAPLQKFFGQEKRMRFEDDVDKAQRLARRSGRRRMAWASTASGDAVRVEDGFLRSRGLGATLVPPMSLVLDSGGIYYDPERGCDLESLIRRRAGGLRPDQMQRIQRVIREIVGSGLSKYNIPGSFPDLPPGHRILVPGQVEDDASILKGSPALQSNAALLRRTREANPDAVLVWKPHPDVDAGLRKGTVDAPEQWADVVLGSCDIASVLTAVDEVWTLTSLAGFEALLRGCRVTVLGAPFYAGWGLTRDKGPVPARRLSGPRPDLAALAHAVLIDYPRYFDPVTGMPCPVEVVLERLRSGSDPAQGPGLRMLAKLQGALSSYAHLWR